ncbi:MAG: hypothetical protein HXX18_14415 [Bacteroidetes bacterium]|nr:hypothetical protein [Bacteroidota bacterium]
MRKNIVTFFIIIFPLLLTSQNISIEKWANYLDSLKQENKLTEQDLSYLQPNYIYNSLYDNTNELFCYFLKNRLVLIETNATLGLDTIIRRYYLMQNSDSIIKVVERHEKYKDIFDKKSYCIKHKDKNGNCDFKSLKIHSETISIYFGKPIEYKLQRDGKKRRFSRKLQEREAKIFIEDYHILKGLIIGKI